jgi:hypothetical protein
VSTPQLRGALSRADTATQLRARREICQMSLAAYAAADLLDAVEINVAYANDDGPLVPPNLLTEVVENETGANLALFLLQELANSADTPERKELLVAARTELLIAANNAQIAEDQMRNDLLDLNSPQDDE